MLMANKTASANQVFPFDMQEALRGRTKIARHVGRFAADSIDRAALIVGYVQPFRKLFDKNPRT